MQHVIYLPRFTSILFAIILSFSCSGLSIALFSFITNYFRRFLFVFILVNHLYILLHLV